MAGIGEASAVIGVVQFGFSLANQLKNYYDDFHEAGEDITNLANVLTSVCSNVQELQCLLDKDVTENGFTEHGRLDAQTCCLQAQKLADKLWKLVSKTNKGEFPKGRVVTVEDIEFSRFRFHWPLWKPQVDRYKAELNFFDLKIMLVKKDYRVVGQSTEERERVVRDMDSLKRAKKRALEDLKDIREKQRERKKKKRVQISDDLPDYRSQTPSSAPSASGIARDSASIFRNAGMVRDETEGRDQEDDPGYEADYDAAGGEELSLSILSEVVDRMAPRLREDIMAEVQEDRRLQAEKDAKQAKERDEAVKEYRRDLLEEWKKSQRQADEMKQQLTTAFSGSGVNEEQITQYVKQMQLATAQGDELAQLLDELGVRAPNSQLDRGESSDGRDVKDGESKGSRRRGLFDLFKAFTNSESNSSQKYPNQRLRDDTSSCYVSDISTATSEQGDWLLSVVVTVDGDIRRASHVNLPLPWIEAILANQNKRRSWKSAVLKETIHTYARLDETSRKQAEECLRDEGVEPKDLVLMYARQLDGVVTKRRRILESTMLAAHPWEYFHGRVLLVYKVQSSTDDAERASPNFRDYDDGRPRNSGRRGHEHPYENTKPSDPESLNKSHLPSGPPVPPGTTADRFEFHNDKDRLEPYIRLEDQRHNAPQHLQSQSMKAAFKAPRYGRVRSRASPGRTNRRSYDEQRNWFNDSYNVREDWHYYEQPHGPARRPIYPKVHRGYLELETLRYYGLPWELDRHDPSYIIILRDLDEYQTQVLFEHTRRLRLGSGAMYVDTYERSGYNDHRTAPPHDTHRWLSRSGRERKLSLQPEYPRRQDSFSGGVYRPRSYDEPGRVPHVDTFNDVYDDVEIYEPDLERREQDLERSPPGVRPGSIVMSDKHTPAPPLSANHRTPHEELVEDLANKALKRTRSRSRSKRSAVAGTERGLLDKERWSSELKKTKERKRGSTKKQSTKGGDFLGMDGRLPSIRPDSLQSRTRSSFDSQRSRSYSAELRRGYTPPPEKPSRSSSGSTYRGPQSRRSTSDHPALDSIVEEGSQASSRARTRVWPSDSRDITSPSLRQQRERTESSIDDCPAKGILKPGFERQGTGDSLRSGGDDGGLDDEQGADLDADSASELFASEMDESESSAAEPYEEGRRRASSSATQSLLGLERRLAESPTSYSNASSGEEDEADASNGPSGTFEDTEADTMAISGYVQPYAESCVDSHFGGHNDAWAGSFTSAASGAAEEPEAVEQEHEEQILPPDAALSTPH